MSDPGDDAVNEAAPETAYDPAERHITVARTARYWILGEEVRAPAEVWFVLHGYRQLARRFLRRFQPLDDGSRLVVAPEGLSRFYVETGPGRHGADSVVGATWMTREDRGNEIADYVAYLDALARAILQGRAGQPVVTVLGFSQGVATACRWTALGTLRPHRLVLWGDFLPPDLPLDTARAAWEATDVVRVRGDRDPIFGADAPGGAEDERLSDAGIASEVVTFPGGHHIDPRVVATLAERPVPRR